MRRTRILATLGPASDSAATIRALLDAGVDAFRLNFSHGTAVHHAEVCARVRTAAAEAGRSIAVVQDLSGPKIRVGPISTPFELTEGDTLVIEHGDFDGGPGRVSSNFAPLFISVQTGQRLLLDDGKIELDVAAVAPGRLTTTVTNGGTLSAFKGINVPNVALRTSAMTPKDVEDLRAGIAMGVDLIALSFVQSADDVRAARTMAASFGAREIGIIAKIEKPQAVEHVEDILAVSDGLMVARGDLGVEIPLETLPAVQKHLILAARRRGVPVIVATQVLESMITEERPTRAEVTDAAHAVDEGADAIMLAGETAAGKHPVQAAAMLASIIREAEKATDYSSQRTIEGSVWTEHGRALCEAAVTLARSAHASAIVAVTEAGATARMLATLRPQATILAATPSAFVASRLSLVWGVSPFVTDFTSMADIREALCARGLVPAGSVVVFVAAHAVLGRDDTNFVHAERV